MTLPNYDTFRLRIKKQRASVTSSAAHASTTFLTGAMHIRPGLVVWEAQTSTEYSISIMVVDGDGGRSLVVWNHMVTDASLVKPNAKPGSPHQKVAHLGRNLTAAQTEEKQRKRAFNRFLDMKPRAPKRLRSMDHAPAIETSTRTIYDIAESLAEDLDLSFPGALIGSFQYARLIVGQMQYAKCEDCLSRQVKGFRIIRPAIVHGEMVFLGDRNDKISDQSTWNEKYLCEKCHSDNSGGEMQKERKITRAPDFLRIQLHRWFTLC
jgi:hypothetical protein